DYVKAIADVHGVEFFDNGFFGFTPRDAEIMDPQLRILLECAWATIEHAGYNVDTYRGAIGVYAGAAPNSYFIENLVPDRELMRALAGPLSSLAIFTASDALSTMVSFKLNLRGPSITVQTACSTSLVAVHLACQSLLARECDMALAGGVNLTIPQERGYLYQKGMILSPDGHCRPFDEDAAGTIFGGGVGLVLLKRLADALADKDCIHAVIKGSAINNDGSTKAGFTAPSVIGQSGAIADALAIADVPADSVSYVEAHGTGTALGDPIEVEALTRAFRLSTERNTYCGVGSVKSNIGHLDRAAGIASLIKTVLSLKHGQIPPTLHFKRPNPDIDFNVTPFYVVDKLTEWKPGYGPRRAVVNSVGFGGTNSCVVLEEPPPPRPSGKSRPYQILSISARTESALDEATRNLGEYFKQHPDSSLGDAAYTLQVGRQPFDCRRIAVCRDRGEAATTFTSLEPSRLLSGRRLATVPSVVFMFPGQGAQYAGMGAELYRSEPCFRAEVDRCLAILQPILKDDLRTFMFPNPGTEAAAERQLVQTRYAQPALFVIEYALAKLWMSWGIKPAAMIGHSVGEHVAACLAEVFLLEDALSLVAERANLVQAQPPGTMLSIRLPEKDVIPFLNADLAVAAVNSPLLCVVSGPDKAIGDLEGRLVSRGVIAQRLQASHAFHSPMMEPVLEPFAARLGRVKLSAPKIPYVSNVTGAWIKAEQATSPAYWAGHVRQTVRFAEGVTTLLGDGPRLFLEVGPGQMLSQMVRQHPEKRSESIVLASLSALRGASADSQTVLEALGKAWIAGISVDWQAFYSHEERNRIPLPTYPFEKKKFWLEPPRISTPVTAVAESSQQNRPIQETLASSDQGQSDSGSRIDSGPMLLSQTDTIEVRIRQLLHQLSGLQLSDFKPSTTFLEMGLDSLFLIQFSRRIEKEFNVLFDLVTLLKNPTIQGVAAIIRDNRSGPSGIADEHDSFRGINQKAPVDHPKGSVRAMSQSETNGKVNIVVREARFEEKELSGILKVLRETLPLPYSTITLADFIRAETHKWLDNPARTTEHVYGWVLESSGNGIVGFIGEVPVRIKIGEREIFGGSGCAFGVLPAYRAYSLMLDKELFEWGKRHFALSTTSNDISSRLNKALGMKEIPIKDFSQQLLWLLQPEMAVKWVLGRSQWKSIQVLTEWFPVSAAIKGVARLCFVLHRQLEFNCPKLSVEPVTEFTEEFSGFWEKNKADYDITTVRDQAFLNWRYGHISNLTGRTFVFVCRDQGQIRGYIALQARAHEYGHLRGLYVVTDLFYERTRKDVLHNLLNYAFEFSCTHGASIFLVSGFCSEVMEELKTQRPYIRRGKASSYWYDGSSNNTAGLEEEKRWWPSGADGDSNL
ncbi:MAG: acyltransferase domain-containing protein, partial [Nitrospira sp.]|nr:acyltransferase domain-containing protein [Nitrospira sp.]